MEDSVLCTIDIFFPRRLTPIFYGWRALCSTLLRSRAVKQKVSTCFKLPLATGSRVGSSSSRQIDRYCFHFYIANRTYQTVEPSFPFICTHTGWPKSSNRIRILGPPFVHVTVVGWNLPLKRFPYDSSRTVSFTQMTDSRNHDFLPSCLYVARDTFLRDFFHPLFPSFPENELKVRRHFLRCKRDPRSKFSIGVIQSSVG